MIMDRQIANTNGQRATKGLKNIINEVERFDEKNVTKFLRVYNYKTKIY